MSDPLTSAALRLQVLWRQFLKFKETELPAKEADKNRSKHIFKSFEVNAESALTRYYVYQNLRLLRLLAFAAFVVFSFFFYWQIFSHRKIQIHCFTQNTDDFFCYL